MWHPSAHWETSRIAAIGPRAARYGRSRPLLTLAPFTALRTRARVKKEYLPTHPWALGKTPARALPIWRATGVNQFADMLTQCGGPLGKDSPPGSLRSRGGSEKALTGLTETVLTTASCVASNFLDTKNFKSARSFAYDHIDDSQRILGKNHRITLILRETYANAITLDAQSSLKQLAEAVEVLGRLARTRLQVFGAHHPCTIRVQKALERAQETLASRQK